MGIKIVFGLAKDEKPDLNVDSSKVRFTAPHLVNVFFINEANDSVLFTFVPELVDEVVFKQVFDLIKDYDVRRKSFVNFITKHEVK